MFFAIQKRIYAYCNLFKDQDETYLSNFNNNTNQSIGLLSIRKGFNRDEICIDTSFSSYDMLMCIEEFMYELNDKLDSMNNVQNSLPSCLGL